MSDITRRLQRHRLSRYAMPESALPRRLRWAWVAGALWLLWIGALSDHSLYRISMLSRDQVVAQRELEQVRGEIRQLDAQLKDPKAQAEHAEKLLREQQGMARPGEIIYRYRDNSRAPSHR